MRFSPLKKKVKTYNNRQQIHLNKADEYQDDYAIIYTPKEHQDLIDEMNDLRLKIDEIKQSDDDKSEIIRLQDDIADNQEMIKQLQRDIKDYQGMIKDYEDKISKHNQELNDHKSVIYDISNKYNNLRIAIKGTSRTIESIS